MRTLAHRFLVVGAHAGLWAAAYLGAFLLRFDGKIPHELRATAVYGFAAILILRSASFWFGGLFHGILRYAGVQEVRSIVAISTLVTIIFVGAGVAAPALRQPRSIYALEWMLAIVATSGLRLGARLLKERRGDGRRERTATPVLLVGAGDAGELLLRDLARERDGRMRVVAILDDDVTKHGSLVHGVRVLGSPTEGQLLRAREDLGAELVILALPSASGARVREIVAACRTAGLETKTLPSLQQIVTGQVTVSMLRDVAIEDLLRREPIQLDEDSMRSLLRGKRVLVTGGAGSIGSELARQAARYEPGLLALLDHNENGVFFLERELRALFPKLSLAPLIGDVKDARRVAQVLSSVRPHVVLHAAAHKHVPLMEENPAEAIKNNVFGTRVVADLANAYGAETFVLISTDKAVNPTSVMGATKRVAEMYLQSISQGARTRFVAVRFGNVLGSAGSVVPLFREQIAVGGPVTVTHPEMRRHFMTIPEASQLVLQAGALARGGEIFVLDMGKPIKIVDLARDMIRMSGLEPDVDVKIVFEGARPGEKLFEELLHESEGYDRTVHPKIMVGTIAPISSEMMTGAFETLRSVLESKPEEIRRAIAQIVPEATLGGAVALRRADVGRALARLEPLETLGLANVGAGAGDV